MINQAKNYLGINRTERLKLFDYYNENVYPLIDKERKYKMRPNDDWCVMFTSVIAIMKGLTVNQFPFEVSVFYQWEKAEKMGLTKPPSYMPKPNDLIVFDWGKGNRFNHVGFVVSVKDGVILTIEGNKNNTVSNRYIRHDSKVIKGYIALNYRNPTTITETPLDDLVRRTINGEFGNGDERREKLGKNYDKVQKLVNDELGN